MGSNPAAPTNLSNGLALHHLAPVGAASVPCPFEPLGSSFVALLRARCGARAAADGARGRTRDSGGALGRRSDRYGATARRCRPTHPRGGGGARRRGSGPGGSGKFLVRPDFPATLPAEAVRVSFQAWPTGSPTISTSVSGRRPRRCTGRWSAAAGGATPGRRAAPVGDGAAHRPRAAARARPVAGAAPGPRAGARCGVRVRGARSAAADHGRPGAAGLKSGGATRAQRCCRTLPKAATRAPSASAGASQKNRRAPEPPWAPDGF